jgi:hypothetical protein
MFCCPVGGTSSFMLDSKACRFTLTTTFAAYHPFDPEGEATEEQLQENIKSGRFDYNDPVWDTVSSSAKDLINHLLVLDPNKRYDTYNVLAHPWIQKHAPPSSSPSDRSASPPSTLTPSAVSNVEVALVSKSRSARIPVRGAFDNAGTKAPAQLQTGAAEYVESSVKRVESKKSNVSLVINTAGTDGALPNRIITSLGSSNQRSISTRDAAGTRFSSSQLSPMPQLSPADPMFPPSPQKIVAAEPAGATRTRTASSKDVLRVDRPPKFPEMSDTVAQANQLSRDAPRSSKYVGAPAGDEFSGAALMTAQNTRASIEDDVVSNASSPRSKPCTPNGMSAAARHAGMPRGVRTETQSFSSSPGRDEHPKMFSDDSPPRTSSRQGRDSLRTSSRAAKQMLGSKQSSMDRSHKLQRIAGTGFPEVDAVDRDYDLADPVAVYGQ